MLYRKFREAWKRRVRRHLINKAGKEDWSAGIGLPPGDWIVQQYIPDLLQTDYTHIAEGIINGVIFGIIIWIAFSIAMMIYEKLRGPKEIQVKVEPTTTPILSEPASARIIEIEGIGSTYAKKLNAQGIKTTDDLLETGGTILEDYL